MISSIILVFATLIPLLVAIAFYTVAERKVIAAVQRRIGPNIVGWWGLLQAFADGLKLVIKEAILPGQANLVIFILAPVFVFVVTLVNWFFVHFNELGNTTIITRYTLLGILILLSLNVYGIVFAGWSSNSRYPFLGAIRSAAQLISYELTLTLTVLTLALLVGSFEIVDFYIIQERCWFIVSLWPLFIIFMMVALAETNRAPFDLPEAEAELVAGYNLEYAAIPFALFFLGEYSAMIFISVLVSILFLGAWPFLIIKVFFIIFIYILVRAVLPRLRYDQLLYLGWQIFLPLVMAYFFLAISLLICLGY